MLDITGDPELKENDGDGAGGHQEAITLRVDAVVVAQINGERVVHLLVDCSHEDGGDDERHEGEVFEDDAIAGDGL